MSRAKSRVITTDKNTYRFLIGIAEERAPEEMYCKSTADFAGFIVNEIPRGLDLWCGKTPFLGPSLLGDALLRATGQKMRPFCPILVDFAAQIYGELDSYVFPRRANPFLIRMLGLEDMFKWVGGTEQCDLVSTPAFKHSFGREACIPQGMVTEESRHFDPRTVVRAETLKLRREGRMQPTGQ